MNSIICQYILTYYFIPKLFFTIINGNYYILRNDILKLTAIRELHYKHCYIKTGGGI